MHWSSRRMFRWWFSILFRYKVSFLWSFADDLRFESAILCLLYLLELSLHFKTLILELLLFHHEIYSLLHRHVDRSLSHLSLGGLEAHITRLVGEISFIEFLIHTLINIVVRFVHVCLQISALNDLACHSGTWYWRLRSLLNHGILIRCKSDLPILLVYFLGVVIDSWDEGALLDFFVEDLALLHWWKLDQASFVIDELVGEWI